MASPRRSPTSLRRELFLSTAVLFVAALLVAVAAAALTLPLLASPAQAALFIALLVGADLAILFLFLRGLFQKSLLDPLERIGADAERITAGEYEHRIAPVEGEELGRLAASLNTMSERLIGEQARLAESVASLDRAHRELLATTDDLVRSARLASVGTLAAGLAHEVGNPLGALVAYLDVARNRADSGGDVRPPIESAMEEAGRIDRIIRSVLAFAHSGRAAGEGSAFDGDAAPISMREVAGRTLDLLDGRGALAGVEVRREFAPGDDRVRVRAQHLEQILMNLLMNARRAAKEGGADPTVTVRTEVEGAQIVVEVADNGPGIPEENLERIFDPFFTTRPPGEGTGVGLAISRRIVEEAGGTIEAFRPEEGGALFRVTLPDVFAKGAADAGAPPSEDPTPGPPVSDGAVSGAGKGALHER